MKNPIIRIFCLSGWLVPINPDNLSSTLFVLLLSRVQLSATVSVVKSTLIGDEGNRLFKPIRIFKFNICTLSFNGFSALPKGNEEIHLK